MSTPLDESAATKKSPLQEIVQPFIDLVHAPRALWGINLAYMIEGFCYFGVLQYLAMYFKQYAGLDDIWSQRSKMVLTAGITIAMFFFGGRADKWGVRSALLGAFVLMVLGRCLLAFAPGAGGSGFSSPMYLVAVGGILLVVLGYGIYQPAAYGGVRRFTTPATASMGFAMLYAVMNLGGWLNSFMTPVRDRYEIRGAYWFYMALTLVSLVTTWFILTRRTVTNAISTADAGRAAAAAEAKAIKSEAPAEGSKSAAAVGPARVPGHLWVVAVAVWCGAAYLAYHEMTALREPEMRFLKVALLVFSCLILVSPLVLVAIPAGGRRSVQAWAAAHPLANAKFFFFIFCLIPVQTLFAYNFGTLQAYVDRAYSAPAVLAGAGIQLPESTSMPAEAGSNGGAPGAVAATSSSLATRAGAPVVTASAPSAEAGASPGAAAAQKTVKYRDLPENIQKQVTLWQRWTIWTGEHFEAATNLNSLLIFILVPIITAFTQRRQVYTMMIVGTLIMAAPAFLLATGTNFLTLGAFIVTMTVGEAIWQPRFLQYAAQIAPEGRTGAYMGVAQFPWFLTKMIVPIYEGILLQKYCPAQGAMNTRVLWLISASIAIVTPVLLILAKGWVGKDMKTAHE
jgi:MFS family permease